MDEYATDSLEHESGLRPLGEYPDHCPRCARAAEVRAAQATCEHGTVMEVTTVAGYVVLRRCDDCGARL